jgi:hypothetical protein
VFKLKKTDENHEMLIFIGGNIGFLFHQQMHHHLVLAIYSLQIKKYMSHCIERGVAVQNSAQTFGRKPCEEAWRVRSTHLPRWEMAGETKENPTPKRDPRQRAGFVDVSENVSSAVTISTGGNGLGEGGSDVAVLMATRSLE